MEIMRAGLKLPDLRREFDRGVKAELRRIFSSTFPAIAGRIKVRLQETVRELISQSPEYQSILFDGELRAELGIPSISYLDDIIDIWVNNISVRYLRNRGLGRLVVEIVRSDYSDVLSSPSASFLYESKNGSGLLEWLRWLLLEGTSPIVLGYDFMAGPRGRTGLGIMMKRDGSAWSVPARFAGVSGDNFVTRSLSELQANLEVIIKQEIKRVRI